MRRLVVNMVSILALVVAFSLSYPFVNNAEAYMTEIISCDNGNCTTTVHQHEDSWNMMISCEDGSSWSGGGSGQWGGSACN